MPSGCRRQTEATAPIPFQEPCSGFRLICRRRGGGAVPPSLSVTTHAERVRRRPRVRLCDTVAGGANVRKGRQKTVLTFEKTKVPTENSKVLTEFSKVLSVFSKAGTVVFLLSAGIRRGGERGWRRPGIRPARDCSGVRCRWWSAGRGRGVRPPRREE